MNDAQGSASLLLPRLPPMTATTVLSALECAAPNCACHASAKNGHGLTHCVAHEDRTPSMNVTEKAGKIVLHCHAGCDQTKVFDVARARGLLGDDPARAEIVATYDYTDENSRLLYQVVRMAPKDFRQRKPDGAGGWNWTMNGVARVLYHLPDIAMAVRAGEVVYVVEGEKDADALRAKGLIATTSPGGAGKWRTEYAEALRGAHVVVVQDKDEAGYKHAADIVRSLEGVAVHVRVVEAITGKDAFDHLAAGHGVDDFAPAKAIRAASPADGRVIDGASFIFDGPKAVEIIWGRDEEVLWAKGESLIVVGPPGVGKTTLAQQVVMARLGLRKEVLGFAVAPTSSKVLLLAMDRPPQIRRSVQRMVSTDDREILAGRLLVWPGPLTMEALDKPDEFVNMCVGLGVDTLCVDSLKDIHPDLTRPEIGGKINALVQLVLAAGVDVIIIHHNRKAQGDNKKPKTIDDVYGAGPITWGAGSVILLWGAPGDLIVEFHHLKQPMIEVGPFKVKHDHEAGLSVVQGEVDVLDLLRSARNGLTVQGVARTMFGSEKADEKQDEKARRRLQSLKRRGLAVEIEGQTGGVGGTEPSRWFAVDSTHDVTHAPATPSTVPSTAVPTAPTAQVQTSTHGAATPSTAPATDLPPYVVGESVGRCSKCETDPVTYDEAGRPLCEEHAPNDAVWWTT